ncbi:helix-turn-helix domain-containing protein [Bifidobacterium pseudolongum]|uniref:helix-turn-helix domain-containing protein n=1 Tax=Bifidobacterium pseudolongum TaxID=1694 RepID=UPI003BF4FB1A
MAWRLYSSREAARIIGVSESTLRRWRDDGDDPPHILVGHRYKYEHDALREWLRDRRRNA